MSTEYSDVAAVQLDALERSSPTELWNAICDALDLVFAGRARSFSTVVSTLEGPRMALAVVGAEPLKVFWSMNRLGPRVEAVFPYTR